MAVYKVPQDVEAEDKLIGPFSFRQFIYLIIAAVGGFLAFMLAKVFLALVILPLPVVVIFLVLALPLRKDQPMETYVVAIIRFMTKPRLRLWDPEGTMSLVNITAPTVVQQQLTKNLSGSEAQQQLGYLAQVVDTGGWATKGVGLPVIQPPTSIDDTVTAEAQSAVDMLDDTARVSQSFDSLISRADDTHKRELMGQIQQYVDDPQSIPEPTTPSPINFNPYPSSMHQRVISPEHTDVHSPKQTPKKPLRTKQTQEEERAKVVPEEVSPDIMRLAHDTELSISTLAQEAHRLEDKEVVISLR